MACRARSRASPPPARVPPTPSAARPTTRPLRLRVRKLEEQYLAKYEEGTKGYEVTQMRYLGGSAHGWALGWGHREPAGELWAGLSPTGRQASGNFEVTHYVCFDACDVLDGVRCWKDVAQLAGAGVSAEAAAQRDKRKATQLDPRKPTYAWRVKPGSLMKLATPVPIDAFCGPWCETSLRTACCEDMPPAMAAAAVLTLVPVKLTKRTAAELGAAPSPAGGAAGRPRPRPRPRARARASPWDSERTALALSLNAVLAAEDAARATTEARRAARGGDSESEEEESASSGSSVPETQTEDDRAPVTTWEEDEGWRAQPALDARDGATDAEDADEDERWYDFVDDEAQDDGASDATQDDEELPSTADRAFINDDTEASNYDADEWEEEHRPALDASDGDSTSDSDASCVTLGAHDTTDAEDDDALVPWKTPPLQADYRRENVRHRDWE